MTPKQLKEALADLKLKRKPVDVPGIDGLFVAEISAEDLDEYNTLLATATDAEGKLVKPMPHLRSALVCKSLVDEDGKRLYTDQELDQVGRLPSAVLETLYQAARRINGVDESAEEAAKN